MTAPTGTQAVDRAAQLLVEVLRSEQPLGFGALVTAGGLPKSTTSRLLGALERHGLVQRQRDGAFRPGTALAQYARRGGAEADLLALAQPILERLGARTGETVNLGVVAPGGVEQIAQVDSRYLLGGTNWVGLCVPLHCSALGKVLLAYAAADLPPGRLERHTAMTITSRTALEVDLAAVRRRGYAVTDEELEPGLVAVAAPVCGYDGAVVAGVSVSGPTARIPADRLDSVGVRCLAEASALSGALGHRPQERTAGQHSRDRKGGA